MKKSKVSVTVDYCSAEVTLKTAAESVGDINSVISRVTPSPPETVNITSCNVNVKKKTTKKTNLAFRAKIAKSSESVYYSPSYS